VAFPEANSLASGSVTGVQSFLQSVIQEASLRTDLCAGAGIALFGCQGKDPEIIASASSGRLKETGSDLLDAWQAMIAQGRNSISTLSQIKWAGEMLSIFVPIMDGHRVVGFIVVLVPSAGDRDPYPIVDNLKALADESVALSWVPGLRG